MRIRISLSSFLLAIGALGAVLAIAVAIARPSRQLNSINRDGVSVGIFPAHSMLITSPDAQFDFGDFSASYFIRNPVRVLDPYKNSTCAFVVICSYLPDVNPELAVAGLADSDLRDVPKYLWLYDVAASSFPNIDRIENVELLAIHNFTMVDAELAGVLGKFNSRHPFAVRIVGPSLSGKTFDLFGSFGHVRMLSFKLGTAAGCSANWLDRIPSKELFVLEIGVIGDRCGVSLSGLSNRKEMEVLYLDNVRLSGIEVDEINSTIKELHLCRWELDAMGNSFVSSEVRSLYLHDVDTVPDFLALSRSFPLVEEVSISFDADKSIVIPAAETSRFVNLRNVHIERLEEPW